MSFLASVKITIKVKKYRNSDVFIKITVLFLYDPYGIRTHVTAVKGQKEPHI